jgi:ferrochelatase
MRDDHRRPQGPNPPAPGRREAHPRADGIDADVAVLLCGYGEVESNDDLTEYNATSLRLLVSKSIRIPEVAIPFLSSRLASRAKAEYERANRFVSPHNAIFESQRAGIEVALRDRFGERVRVFSTFNFCDGLLPHQVLPRIRDAGYSRVVVYPLLVVDSVYTGGLSIEQVNKALGHDGAWVRESRYLPSFFDRPDFHERLAEHVRQGVAPLRDRYPSTQIGIVLLNHGCPYRAKGFETGIRESRLLYHHVRGHLVHEYPAISVGWMNHPTPGRWTQPDVLQAARNLVTLGVHAVAMVPIGFVTDNHETILDIGYTREQLRRLHPDLEVLQLASLNEDPTFLRLAADWIAPLVVQAGRGPD